MNLTYNLVFMQITELASNVSLTFRLKGDKELKVSVLQEICLSEKNMNQCELAVVARRAKQITEELRKVKTKYLHSIEHYRYS